MTSETQILDRGKYANERPTESQLEFLRRMGVKAEIIRSLDRKGAFELIRKYIVQYYDTKAEQYLHRKGALKW